MFEIINKLSVKAYSGCNLNCCYCVSGDTKITMSDLTSKSIKDIKIGDEVVAFNEMSAAIKQAMKKLPQREQDLIEAKFFHDKKLRELSDDFDISPSRISRIIQSGLNKIRKELEKENLL